MRPSCIRLTITYTTTSVGYQGNYVRFSSLRSKGPDNFTKNTTIYIDSWLPYFYDSLVVQVPWAIGNGRLNTSPKLDAYTSIPSTPSSIAALLLTEGCLFSGKASSLDAFRSYPKQLSCSACPVGQLINQRLRCPVPLVLGATSPQTTTPLSGRDRPVSRRSKPSSRSPLMGEQPHPWLLLQNQDGKSRHRGTKPRGR